MYSRQVIFLQLSLFFVKVHKPTPLKAHKENQIFVQYANSYVLTAVF